MHHVPDPWWLKLYQLIMGLLVLPVLVGMAMLFWLWLTR